MRCISDELIQKYIDSEASVRENSRVQRHLATCGKCAERVKERQYAADRMKALLRSLNSNDIQLPVFREPEEQRKASYINLRRIVYVASAACLLVLFLIFHPEPKEEMEFLYSYDLESEYNANLPVSEQEMAIEIMDSNGKLIKH